MTQFHASFENTTITDEAANATAQMILRRPDRKWHQTYLEALGIEENR